MYQRSDVGAVLVCAARGLLQLLRIAEQQQIAGRAGGGQRLSQCHLAGFVDDPWTSGVIATSIVLGGIGFPVLMELRRLYRRPRRWSLPTQITLVATALLIAGGALAVLVIEWSNPNTLGPMGIADKAIAGLFQGITPRTAGFNTIDYGAMRESSIVVTIVLMFIGGGSASTASGIKVTTFAVLAWVIWAELRGDREVDSFRRRIPAFAQRQAIGA